MNNRIKFIILVVYFASPDASSYVLGNFGMTDTSSHFYSIVDRTQFDSLHDTEFTWLVFTPINDSLSMIPFHKRNEFVQNLSDEQKVLFYIQNLEAAVMGGLGFLNFYYNYDDYIQGVTSSLMTTHDTAMLNVLRGANKIYLTNKNKIRGEFAPGEWDHLQKKFSATDSAYFNSRNYTMKLLEQYIRNHSNEFVRFK